MDAFCFCKHARPAILAWGYIKLVLMLLSLFPLYLIVVTFIFCAEQYKMILFWSLLLLYPFAFGFDITLIVAAHLRNVKTLKVCLYYLIIELSMLTLLIPWIVRFIFVDYSVMPLLCVIAVMTSLVIAQGVFSIIMVNSEIGKLSDVHGVAHEEVGYTNLKNGKEVGCSKYSLYEKHSVISVTNPLVRCTQSALLKTERGLSVQCLEKTVQVYLDEKLKNLLES
ncbi:hypothetical protein K1T71_008448 [Dendrolimus kikuchii]|uniref:Uncharacterized protein n=1 Tax=Dendrolimus kikuchii TaxID=765133 RepID=A0ACC1CXQ1_9NEOP|nr:hypothetical protein K1T71_008448 [Dendrolimus kikuchii]